VTGEERCLSGLLPDDIAVAESDIGPEAGELTPAERAMTRRMAAPRRNEFAAGRRLFRQLLAQRGLPVTDLLSDADRVPLWPPGFTGSIAHARTREPGRCAVALGDSRRWAAIGIDIERSGALPTGVESRVVMAAEQAGLQRLGLSPADYGTVLFAVKEAVYKAWFPVNRRFLDFSDVLVELDPHRARFEASVVGGGDVPGACRAYMGRYRITRRWVAAATAV
jgi:4'-phosphopantetheinyl transferase EntD